ncbi:MAG: hypothetical protein KBF78_14560, partial [Fuscovulum sp.]|nr:hypothetical protein [Fuscovulum sp.]
TNPRTGDRRIVPQGIDPGWERNPGKLRLQAVEGMLKDRLAAAPEPVRRAALKDIASSWRLHRMATEPDAVGNVPVAILPPALAEAAGTDIRIVEFSDITRRHVFTAEKNRRVDDLRWLAYLDTAERVALQQREGQNARLIFDLAAAANPGSNDPYERWPLRVILVVKAAGVFVDTMHRTTERRWNTLKKSAATKVLRE